MTKLVGPDSDLARNVANYGGRSGEQWLMGLDARVAELAVRWQLTGISALTDLSMNFVARATRDGDPVVLKVGWETDAIERECAWLEHYSTATRGAVIRVLESDGEGAYLMPLLNPGTCIDQRPDDDATVTIGLAIKALGSVEPRTAAEPLYPSLDDWFSQLATAGEAARHALGPRIDRAEAIARELSIGHAAALLHGDLHHLNVLADGDRWIVTDPHGVTGDPAHECAAMLRNALTSISGDVGAGVRRRADVLATTTGFERARIAGWGFAQNVLSCVWSLDSDENADVQAVITVADALAG